MISFAFNVSYAQNKTTDTIYIKYDAHCLEKVKNPGDKKKHYIFSSKGKNGSFWFTEKNKIYNPRIKQDIRLCDSILSEKSFYTYKNNPGLRNNYMVYKYFNDSFIYLVNENSIIELIPHYAIE